MSKSNFNKTFFFATISMLVAIVVLVSSTFAWFTNNTKVDTDTVSGKTGVASLALLIGQDEGSLQASGTEGVEIGMVNDNADKILYPVSTSNLEKFFYCPMMIEGKAKVFAQDNDEKRIFHGRVYLKLEGENVAEGQAYKLYLDNSENSGGQFGVASTGYMLNASRLGLKLGDSTPVIFKFNEESKGTTENNTVINGETLAEGYVIEDVTSDGKASAVNDPAVSFDGYTLDSSASVIEIPENALATMELNTVYPLDVYFYLEGCDEDCVESISLNDGDIHLAFYVISE